MKMELVGIGCGFQKRNMMFEQTDQGAQFSLEGSRGWCRVSRFQLIWVQSAKVYGKFVVVFGAILDPKKLNG